MKGQADVMAIQLGSSVIVQSEGFFDRDSIQHSFLEISQLLSSTNRQILAKESK